jgi:hypothetical protein
MFLSQPLKSGEKWDTDPTSGMIVDNRSFPAGQKLPYAWFFEGLVRHCLLNYLKEEVHEPKRLRHFLEIEQSRGSIAPYQKLRAVEILHGYLLRQWERNRTPFSATGDSGAAYVLAQIAGAISHFKNATARVPADSDPLDL